MERRAHLQRSATAIGMSLLSGCGGYRWTGFGGQGYDGRHLRTVTVVGADGAKDAEAEYPLDVRGEFVVPHGEYGGWALVGSFSRPVEYELRVRDGTPIDVFVLPDEERSNYVGDEAVTPHPLSAMSSPPTRHPTAYRGHRRTTCPSTTRHGGGGQPRRRQPVPS